MIVDTFIQLLPKLNVTDSVDDVASVLLLLVFICFYLFLFFFPSLTAAHLVLYLPPTILSSSGSAVSSLWNGGVVQEL